MATCHLCPPGDSQVPDVDLLRHMRVIHPEETERFMRWLDEKVLGAETWPDGSPVVIDETLEPDDFRSEP